MSHLIVLITLELILEVFVFLDFWKNPEIPNGHHSDIKSSRRDVDAK